MSATTHRYPVDALVRMPPADHNYGYKDDAGKPRYGTIIGTLAREDYIREKGEPYNDGTDQLYIVNVGNVFGHGGMYEYVAAESELKPWTDADDAERANLHDDCVCRVCMDTPRDAEDRIVDHAIELEKWISEHLRDWPTPMRDFIQVDGFTGVPGDDVMSPDENGDSVMLSRTRDPQRSGTTVRILIAAEADREDVLRILRKQVECIESETGPLSAGWLRDTDPF